MNGFGDAVEAQVQASDPGNSTWVCANAGSGKTRVLTDRVARLLLRGTEPSRILCLTYTKAAASEMQNRLFQRLGAWAMMPDEKLRETLYTLGEEAASTDAENLRQARTLFANALETPGGLRIQTIHSFCDHLLRQFPLEAGVPPQFQTLEETAAKQLRSNILDEMSNDQDVALVADMAKELTGSDIDGLLQEVVAKRDVLRADRVSRVFGSEEPDSTSQMTYILGTGDREAMNRVAEHLGANEKQSATIRASATETDPRGFVDLAERLFLNNTGSKRGAFSPKIIGSTKIREQHPADFAAFDAIGDRVANTRRERAAGRMAVRASRLANFAERFLERYDYAKLLAGQFDFSDLIRKVLYLLENSASAQWILYRLDGGIDHVLVDEAQDTSPEQWRIILKLTEEFTAGNSGRDRKRTMFVVGDEKQSIYSFQGADPKIFTEMQTAFGGDFQAIGSKLVSASLLHSFRTSDPILRFIDATFHGPAGEHLQKQTLHRAVDVDRPGRVDIWPFIEKPEVPEEVPWYTPVDTPDPDDPKKILAQQVARWIRYRIDRNTVLPGTNSPISAGDFLILVQRRSVFFNHVIRALKSHGVPVAGADRMWIADELAVKDILSFLRWADLPDDDLSLAEVMRSPLLGMTEQELFSVAHGRKGTLWQALRTDDRFQSQRRVLSDILDNADFERPFEMITRILTRNKGREKLVARLGEEAEDAIDELLTQALRYEQTNIVTLSGFLAWFDAENIVVKREMDRRQDQVRVMTVHGAKGLEAPIVILPDTAKQFGRSDRDAILPLAEGGFVWRTPSGDERGITRQEIDAKSSRSDFQKAEKMRLLYVAMTRAERWLVIAGAGERGNAPQDCWYGLIEETCERVPSIACLDPIQEPVIGRIRSMSKGWTDKPFDGPVNDDPSVDLPDWARTPVPAEIRYRPLNPSGFPGAKSLPGVEDLDEEAVKRRGTQVHLLLEHLPGVPHEMRRTVAGRLLAGDAGADLSAALEEAEHVIDTPNLQWLWADQALSEVPITGEILGRRVEGVVDRLIVTGDHVIAVDFKTNRVVPATADAIPEGILRQLGAYDAVLRQIYREKPVSVGVLWTKTAAFMIADRKLMSAALATVPLS
ncbi:MAG: double-strand break repair helicase AddA [Rhodobacteraceae bacterium]|nr:double-strand break repair helicase AddA [Paracoccaceae bacterium]